MTSTYEDGSPWAKLCQVCRYLVDRLDDGLQQLAAGVVKNWRSEISYPHSLGHREFLQNAKDGCAVCMSLVDSLLRDHLAKIQRDGTEQLDCKSYVRLSKPSSHQSASNSSFNEAHIAVWFLAEIGSDSDVLFADMKVRRRAEGWFYIYMSFCPLNQNWCSTSSEKWKLYWQ